MAVSETVSWFRSERTLLAASTFLDLAVRLPEDIIVPILSLSVGLFDLPTLGVVTTWVMFAVALYTFAPLCYTHLDVLPSDQHGFRGLFAGGAIGLGIAINSIDSGGLLVVVAPLLVVGTGSGLLFYLTRQHGLDVAGP